MIFSKALSAGVSASVGIGGFFTAESNESLGVWGFFWLVVFFNGASLQAPEKFSRHPNHRGGVEILLYVIFMR